VQCQQAGASSAGVQPIHVLRNHATHGTQLFQLGERIVGAVRFGAAHAAPTHVGARPVALAGYVIVAEFLVGHGAVVVQGTARSAVVGDAGFGAYSRAGEHENLTALEQLGNTRGGVFFVVRGGVLRDNALNRCTEAISSRCSPAAAKFWWSVQRSILLLNALVLVQSARF